MIEQALYWLVFVALIVVSITTIGFAVAVLEHEVALRPFNSRSSWRCGLALAGFLFILGVVGLTGAFILRPLTQSRCSEVHSSGTTQAPQVSPCASSAAK